jgi:hypothetical protein
MRADDLADARALAPALDILLSPNPGVRIFDIGANFDRRYFDWAVSMGLAEDCRKLGIDVIGLVPMTSDADAVTLGARTAVRFGLAFPDYLTLPVLCDDGVDVTKLLDSNTRQVFERAFGAKVERGEFLKHHRLLPGALAMLEASRLSASRLRLATARNISFHHTFPPAMTVRPRRAALGKSGGRGSTRSGR